MRRAAILATATLTGCSYANATSHIAPIVHLEGPREATCCNPVQITGWYYDIEAPLRRTLTPVLTTTASGEVLISLGVDEAYELPFTTLVGAPAEEKRGFLKFAASFAPVSPGTYQVRPHPHADPYMEFRWSTGLIEQFQHMSGLSSASVELTLDIR